MRTEVHEFNREFYVFGGKWIALPRNASRAEKRVIRKSKLATLERVVSDRLLVGEFDTERRPLVPATGVAELHPNGIVLIEFRTEEAAHTWIVASSGGLVLHDRIFAEQSMALDFVESLTRDNPELRLVAASPGYRSGLADIKIGDLLKRELPRAARGGRHRSHFPKLLVASVVLVLAVMALMKYSPGFTGQNSKDSAGTGITRDPPPPAPEPAYPSLAASREFALQCESLASHAWFNEPDGWDFEKLTCEDKGFAIAWMAVENADTQALYDQYPYAKTDLGGERASVLFIPKQRSRFVADNLISFEAAQTALKRMADATGATLQFRVITHTANPVVIPYDTYGVSITAPGPLFEWAEIFISMAGTEISELALDPGALSWSMDGRLYVSPQNI